MTRDELGRMLGIQARRIDELRKLLPKDAQRREGRAVLIDAQVATRTWFERQNAARRRRRREQDPDDPDDEYEGVAESPAREQLIAAKAAIAELELAKLRGQLIPVVDLREALDTITAAGRQLGENLGRLYGPEAARQVNHWLELMATTVGAAEDAA